VKHLISAIVDKTPEALQLAKLTELQNKIAAVHQHDSQTPVALDPLMRSPFSQPQLKRWEILTPPQFEFCWLSRERFIKSLATAQNRCGFELHKNPSSSFRCVLLAHEQDFPLIEISLRAQFPHSQLIPLEETYLYSSYLRVAPQNPLSQLLTNFEELEQSPLNILCEAMLHAHTPTCYQCIFEPAHPNWHSLLASIRDQQYMTRLLNGPLSHHQALLQQSPLTHLQEASHRLTSKSHPDKPLFAVSLRIGMDDFTIAPSMLGFLAQFLYEGTHFTTTQRANPTNMTKAITHQPGFILNSKELTGLAHIPDFTPKSQHLDHFKLLSPFSHLETPKGNTVLGHQLNNPTQEASIPDYLRQQGIHIMSASGGGKSTLMIQMLLQDITQGQACIFIDPHGEAAKDILIRLDQKSFERCIYFNPALHDRVPLWNPLKVPKGMTAELHGLELLSALEHTFSDWGDRMAYVLRSGILGLLELPQATLSDLFQLVRRKSQQSEQLRAQILQQESLEAPIRGFWERDFHKDYREVDLAASKHKLSQILTGSTLRMFSQPQGKISMADVMQSQKILLIDLSGLSEIQCNLVGSLLLHECKSAIMARGIDLHPVSLYVDECHRFVAAQAIEPLLVQARKFGMQLCFAHQYLSQFHTKQIDAINTAGCTILGRLNRSDADYLAKQMPQEVLPKHLQQLPRYEFLARIDHDVTHFQSTPLTEDVQRPLVEGRERSLANYYTSIIRKSAQTSDRVDLSAYGFTDDHFAYELFD